MKKDTAPSNKQTSNVNTALIPESASYVGAVLFFLGMAAVYMSGRAQPAGVNWMNYVGIGLAVCGALLWFTSGMDRAQLFEWLRSGLTALLLALAIRWAIAEPYRIPSGSMETTLHGDPRFGRGDRVFVNKWVYGVRFPFMNKRIWHGQAPQRWDQVVFKTVEPDAIHKTLVKRIVGMPGEHLQIRNGRIHVNGEAIPLPPGMPPETYYTTPLDGPYGVQASETFSQIPEGCYLVLGDNSAHSRDGRYFGWLPNEHIVGRVACIWWPPPRWRDFTGFSQTWWWRATVALLALLLIARLFFGRLCPAPNPDNPKATDHLLVSLVHYGPHVPFLNRNLYCWRAPVRGDMTLYSARDPKTGQEHLLLGRVAALPGERVALQEGVLTVNDEEVVPFASRKYDSLDPEARYGRGRSREFTVTPEGHYFILSDEASTDETTPIDGRTLGWTPANRILGRALWCWWPLKRMGRR